MRRLLMVAYTFPPVAGVGIERNLKHATYLPDAGWQPVVVAPSNPGYRLVDPATLERVPPGTEVHRAPSLEPAHLRRLVGSLVRRGRTASTRSSAAVAGASRAPGPLNDLWRTYVRLAWFPDEQIAWAASAIAVGHAAHRAGAVDAIYSSGPPFSTHLAGALLKSLTGRPWIADFRDPWIGNAYAAPLPAPHRALRASLERSVVERADRSVFASAGVRDEYADRYPTLAERFVTIHNGYDLDDISSATGEAAPPQHRDARFELIFTGSVQGVPEFTVFADGIERLLQRRPQLRDRFVVRFVGWFSPEVEAAARQRLPALGAAVERLGYRPKAETLALLRQADAALVLLAAGPGREHVPSAKLFDYLGVDVPVLAVAPHGEVRRILAELDWGVGADPTPEGFADGVERLLEASRPNRPADPERRFERRGLSARLATLLDEVAG